MSVTTKSIIAVGAAAFLALAGAVSTADAGRGGGKGGGFKGGGIHMGGGAKFKGAGGSMGKFHGSSAGKSLRYGGGSKFKGYGGGSKFKSHGHGKQHAHGGKGSGKHGHFRRFGYYPWYGLPLYSYGYGGGCGWLYRQAVATGSDYWWNRYYQCTGSYY
jgi:hypothetical protein